MLATGSHRCSLQLAPDTSVEEAVAQATRQVLRNVVESRGGLGPIGEHISVSVLPSANGATTVSEWARRNLGQAPMVVVKSDESEENSSLAPRQAEVCHEDVYRKLQHEHAHMMGNLQKLLQGQTKTIERQAEYIDDLQEREQQMSQLLSKTIAHVEIDIASLKGDVLNLEEHIMEPQENGQPN